MDIRKIRIDYAVHNIEKFVDWVKTRNPELVEQILINENDYKVSDVEKLFNSLDDEKKTNYQFSIDNEHNFINAARYNLPDASHSMPTGEPGHYLKAAFKSLKEESIENICRDKFVEHTVEVTHLGETPTLFNVKDGTDMSTAIESAMKKQSMENINKVRQVFIITDGDVPKDPKPKK